MSFTHSARLERWLGTDMVEQMSANMKDWYGPPIPVANVPGRIYAMPGGDFCGAIRGGYLANLTDYAFGRIRRIVRNWGKRQMTTLNTGFSSLSDLINEATLLL